MENSTTLQWWIQDFPDGGANLWVWRKKPIIWQISAENCMKMKEIGSANVMELLPPANEVAGRQCFYTCLSVHREGVAPFHIPHPPRDHAPPETIPPSGTTPQEPQKRVVRILLECFLVDISVSFVFQFGSGWIKISEFIKFRECTKSLKHGSCLLHVS